MMRFEGVSRARVIFELVIASLLALTMISVGIFIVWGAIEGIIAGHRIRTTLGILPVAIALSITAVGSYLINPRRSAILRALLK